MQQCSESAKALRFVCGQYLALKLHERPWRVNTFDTDYDVDKTLFTLYSLLFTLYSLLFTAVFTAVTSLTW